MTAKISALLNHLGTLHSVRTAWPGRAEDGVKSGGDATPILPNAIAGASESPWPQPIRGATITLSR